MPIYINRGGASSRLNSIYTNKDGSQITNKNLYTNVDNVRKEIYNSNITLADIKAGDYIYLNDGISTRSEYIVTDVFLSDQIFGAVRTHVLPNPISTATKWKNRFESNIWDYGNAIGCSWNSFAKDTSECILSTNKSFVTTNLASCILSGDTLYFNITTGDDGKANGWSYEIKNGSVTLDKAIVPISFFSGSCGNNGTFSNSSVINSLVPLTDGGTTVYELYDMPANSDGIINFWDDSEDSGWSCAAPRHSVKIRNSTSKTINYNCETNYDTPIYVRPRCFFTSNQKIYL